MKDRATESQVGTGRARKTAWSASLLLAAGWVPLCGPVGARAQSLDAAQAASFEQSLVLRSDRARQEGAEARLRGSLDAFMPTAAFVGSKPLDSKITYNPDIPYTTFGPDTTRRRDVTQYGITVALPLYDGLQRWNTLLSSRSFAEAGRHLTVGVQQQVLLDTASAYIAVMRDRRILAQRQRQLASVQTIRTGVAAQLSVNDATRTDTALADSRVADAQAGIAQAAADLRASELEFIRLTGHPPDRLQPPRLPPLPRSEAELADSVRGANPRLAAARLDAQAARYMAEAARGALLPQVSFEFTHGRQSDITGTLKSVRETTTKVQAKIPLYEPGAIPKIAETAAFAQQKWYDTEDAVLQTVTIARVTFQRRAALQGQIASLAVRVTALRAAVRGYEIERGAGFRTVLDELNSRAELAAAEILLATGEAERDRLAFVLAALAGSLGPARGPTLAGPIPLSAPPDPFATGSVIPPQVPAAALRPAKPSVRPKGGQTPSLKLRLGTRGASGDPPGA